MNEPKTPKEVLTRDHLALLESLNLKLRVYHASGASTKKMNKGMEETVTAYLEAIREAGIYFRATLIEMDSFNALFSFKTIRQYLEVTSPLQLSILETFIEYQLEMNMHKLYILDEDKLQFYSPLERNTIRKSNKSSQFHLKVQRELELGFPVEFLNNNLGSEFFNASPSHSIRILKIGLRIIMCYLRNGFYSFRDLGDLLTFVRQKYRFLRTWNEQSKFAAEGQWFMVKFTKHSLFILVDYVYQLLMDNSEKLEKIVIFSKASGKDTNSAHQEFLKYSQMDESQSQKKGSKGQRAIPLTESSHFLRGNLRKMSNSGMSGLQNSRRFPMKGQKPSKFRANESSPRNSSGYLSSERRGLADQDTEMKTKKMNFDDDDQFVSLEANASNEVFGCQVSYEFNDSNLNIGELLEILKLVENEEQRKTEENLILLEEIFINSVLGWTAASSTAFDSSYLDNEILLLSEYMFNLKGAIEGFYIEPQIDMEKQGEQEELTSNAYMTLHQIIEGLKKTDSMEDKMIIFNKLIKMLKKLKKSEFNIQQRVKLASIIKNVIEILLSIHEYLNIQKQGPSKRQRNNERRVTRTSILFRRQSNRKNSEIKPDMSIQNSINKSSFLLQSNLTQGLYQIEDNREILDKQEQLIGLITEFCSIYLIVSDLVLHEDSYWSLLEIFPLRVLREVTMRNKEFLFNYKDKLLEYLSAYLLKVEKKVEEMDYSVRVRAKLVQIYAAEIMMQLIYQTRQMNGLDYQFECKVFNHFYRVHKIFDSEKILLEMVNSSQFGKNDSGRSKFRAFYNYKENMLDRKVLNNPMEFSREIQYRFVYGILSVLELSSQRFVCSGFGDVSDILQGPNNFLEQLFDWTKVRQEAVNQMNRIKELDAEHDSSQQQSPSPSKVKNGGSGILDSRGSHTTRQFNQQPPQMPENIQYTKVSGGAFLASGNLMPLLVPIFKLQTNLFLKASNAVLDDTTIKIQLCDTERSKDKIFEMNSKSADELVRNNIALMEDQRIASSLQNLSLMNRSKPIIKAVMEQVIHLLMFLNVMKGRYESDQLITYEILAEMLWHLKNIMDSPGSEEARNTPLSKESTPKDSKNIMASDKNVELSKENISSIKQKMRKKIEVLINFIQNCGLDVDLRLLRRQLISLDEENKQIFSQMTQHSLRQINKVNLFEQRIFSSLKTSCNFEVDTQKMLLGFSMMFLRVFSRMTRPNTQEKTAKEACRTKWRLLSRKYFFFDKIYTRFLSLFERLSLEFGSFKEELALVFQNGLMVDQKYCRRAFENLFDVVVHLGKDVQRAVYLHSDWAIIFSQHYLAISLLMNLTENQLSFFKKIYGNQEYSKLERGTIPAPSTFLKVIARNLESSMLSLKFNQLEIGRDFSHQPLDYYKTGYSHLVILVDFFSSCISGAGHKNEEFITKNLAALLLKFLLFRTRNLDHETTSLKVAISQLVNLLVSKTRNPKQLQILNQNGLELKIAFQYTLHLTKMELIKILIQTDPSSQQVKFKSISFSEIEHQMNKNTLTQVDTDLAQISQQMILGSKNLDKKSKNALSSHTSLSKLPSRNTFTDFNSLRNDLNRRKSGQSGKNSAKVIMNRTVTKRKLVDPTLSESQQMNDNEAEERKIFQQDIFTLNPSIKKARKLGGKGNNSDSDDESSSPMVIDYNQSFITDVKQMNQIYSFTTSKNKGFHLINSMLNIMKNFQQNFGGKYWSLRKKESQQFYQNESGASGAMKSMPLAKIEELAIVKFLVGVNREIEVLDRQGNNQIVLFQKFPELMTVRDIIVDEFFQDFDSEMVLHKLIKFIPQILIQVKYNHKFNLEHPLLFSLVTRNNIWYYLIFIWCLGLGLNLICLFSYKASHEGKGTILVDEEWHTILINIIAMMIGLSSIFLVAVWFYSKYRVLYYINIEKHRIETQASSVEPGNQYSSFYTRLAFNVLFQENIISVLLHIMFSFLGVFYSRMFHACHLLLFVFISKPIWRVITAIFSNTKEMGLIFVFATFIIYVYSVIALAYFYDNFETEETRGFDVCESLFGCFMNILDMGMRMGGGIGERMSLYFSTSEHAHYKVIYSVTFFVLINVIALNMIFGIIIDAFSQIRENEYHKRKKTPPLPQINQPPLYLPNLTKTRTLPLKLLSCLQREKNRLRGSGSAIPQPLFGASQHLRLHGLLYEIDAQAQVRFQRD